MNCYYIISTFRSGGVDVFSPKMASFFSKSTGRPDFITGVSLDVYRVYQNKNTFFWPNPNPNF